MVHDLNSTELASQSSLGVRVQERPMTDNEKIARWQGWELDDSDEMCHIWMTPDHRMKLRVPDYLNDDAAIMSLLDTLVEKGYTYQLLESFRVLPDTKVQHRLRFGKQGKENLCGMVAIGGLKPTRREAVVAAVLKLIADNP